VAAGIWVVAGDIWAVAAGIWAVAAGLAEAIGAKSELRGTAGVTALGSGRAGTADSVLMGC